MIFKFKCSLNITTGIVLTYTDYGVYYAFDRPYIQINQGDFVTWTWETPEFINDVAHSILEVDSPSSTTAKLGGFNSGTPSKNGNPR